MTDGRHGGHLRHAGWSALLAALVVTAAVTVPGGGAQDGRAGAVEPQPSRHAHPSGTAAHRHGPGAPTHDHHDPATKNSVSRSMETGPATLDPTTAEERRANAAYAARSRTSPDPPLTTAAVRQPRHRVPEDRYAMAGGCYTLGLTGGRYVTGDDARRVRRVARVRATRFRFQATSLGHYLLYLGPRRFLAGSDGAGLDERPSRQADWTVRRFRGGFRFALDTRHQLTVRDGRLAVGRRPARFALRLAARCAAYPEAQVNVRGRPHAGVTGYQEVRGYADAHTHGMAFEFLGGEAHCGRPWHRYGAPYALVDCPDHRRTRTNPLEAFLSGRPFHDPVGWPTFKDWPAPDSLTHEGTYWRWLERSWRGGQRLFVNLLVENNQLCQVYPFKRNSCDDMDSVRLQARDMYQLQDYIDAQYGGPGEGFYRIVTNPFQARRVINAGKMAVVMGIETSVPFGCSIKLDVPTCDAARIDRQLDMVHRLGVRQMELVNKFDNALAGVAGDEGSTGAIVNSANFKETGSFWDMRHCEPPDGESHDKNQYAAPEISPQQQDAIFGAIGEVYGIAHVALPVYPPPDHCNARGLTALGRHTIAGLVKRHMVFDPDHMSVKARNASLDQLERLHYPGVISSHSWATPDAYPRIYRLGGFITPYAGDSTGFVEKWRRHLGWADDRYYFGFGYGADINGLGAQGDPRGADVPNPVTYPVTGLAGVRIGKQHAGRRVYDLNVDGVAQYGLYPDWVEDLRQVAGADGDAIVEDMTRGAEAYLQMWERAQGIAPDSCRNPGLRLAVARLMRVVRPGMTTRQVMQAVGQPFTRSGRRYGVCAKTTTDPNVRMTVEFNRAGRVVDVRRA